LTPPDSARAVLLPGRGKNWQIVEAGANPSNTPTGIDQDYVVGSTVPSKYRQAIQ
jgi:hypothetical protein